MMGSSCLGGGCLPVAVMLCLNVAAAVMVSLVKVAMDGGMNPLVIVTVQQLTASVFLAPIAFFKERLLAVSLSLRRSISLISFSRKASDDTLYLFSEFQEVEAKADAGDLRLHLRQCGARVPIIN